MPLTCTCGCKAAKVEAAASAIEQGFVTDAMEKLIADQLAALDEPSGKEPSE